MHEPRADVHRYSRRTRVIASRAMPRYQAMSSVLNGDLTDVAERPVVVHACCAVETTTRHVVAQCRPRQSPNRIPLRRPRPRWRVTRDGLAR
jgi:hypothetical protein